MIELGFPWALALLPLPWLIWRFVPPHREQIPAFRIPFFRRITQAVGETPQAGAVILRRRRRQMLVAILAWTLMVLALARPERVGEPVEQTKAARDVILAIDISGSMDRQDFANADGELQQRLEAVKQVVGAFIDARQGDRVALIVFGTKAYVQSPFTEDLRTVRELLDSTRVGMAGPHTVIGDAIGLAIRTFESSDVKQRLLILLSDGADTGSMMSPRNAAQIAAQNGVEIHTIGVGDPQGSGEEQVDLQALQRIARLANGRFFIADDQAALSRVYQRIDSLAPRQIETLSYRPRHSLAHWPLALASVLMLACSFWLHWQSRAGKANRRNRQA